jgi:hypothetical protein
MHVDKRATKLHSQVAIFGDLKSKVKSQMEITCSLHYFMFTKWTISIIIKSTNVKLHIYSLTLYKNVPIFSTLLH